MKDHLLKIYAQIKDLFLSMTPGNRVIAALLTATLIVSLGYLLVGSIKTGDTKSKMVDLMNGYEFDSQEKTSAETALRRAGFDDFQWVGNVLRVPTKLASAYTATIAEAGVLTPKGLEKFKAAMESSPWESAKMRDEKDLAAREIDLANFIKQMSGIDEATVMSNKRMDWHRNVWAREQKFSVAVNVRPTYNTPLDDSTIISIGSVVARVFGVTDLKEITIVDNKNNISYYGSGAEVSGGSGDYLKHQRLYEERWNKRIYELLPLINGLKVDTTVTLTEYINRSQFNVTHGDPTVLAEHVKGLDYERFWADRWGRVGQVAQIGRPLIDPENGMDNRSYIKEKRHEQETNNALQGTEMRDETIPFIPVTVFPTLQIPREYVRQLWLTENAPTDGTEPVEPTPEELQARETQLTQEVKASVSHLLTSYWNKKLTPDPLDMVRVSYYRTIPEKVVELTAWEKTQQWLMQNWQNLSLMGLVLCGLCVLWSVTKPAKPEPIVIYEAPEIPMEVIEAKAALKAEAEAAAAAAEEDDEELSRTLDGFDKSIRSLQDEIAELIEENPDAAAAVLRQWIGNAVLVEKQG